MNIDPEVFLTTVAKGLNTSREIISAIFIHAEGDPREVRRLWNNPTDDERADIIIEAVIGGRAKMSELVWNGKPVE